MSTEERDETQPRPKKVIPSIRRENTDQESDRRPYYQGYEGNNYERRPYNRQQDGGGYRSYDDNRSYGGQQNRQRYDSGNRGAYGNNRQEGGGYGNNRPAYGNNRPAYGNNYDRGYNEPRPQYNRPRGGYEGPARAYSATPSGDGTPGEGVKKRRPRVGDRANTYDNNRQGGYGNNNPAYGNNRGDGGGYGQNRRPQLPNRRPRPQGQGGNYNPNARYGIQKQLKYKEVLADPNEPIRLNKFLSNAGVCSRREADEFIQAGVVKVNGEIVSELGTKITRQDEVLFNERSVKIESKVYIVLNKPKNTVTTSDDPQERRTVMDLVKSACKERIYPVGRLDRNTTGVLLLTNDGDLASKLTHPSFKKKKIYHVWLDKAVAIEDMEKIANGLELEDGEIHADAISYASEEDKSQVGIEIHSGRNRIVRRIFESLGYHVMKLDRVYFAGLTKKNLGKGKWRYLNEREVNALRMGAFE